ncbi:MAG TPA: tetratricopeptide repeat protein [Bryobacteraceae bacterium]|nr:tetratricopeptide repeat protein [Bryobacteraceae bacterium]
MRLCFLTLLAASLATAADEQQLALELRAQSDFERVQMAAVPDLTASTRCVQSEAAVLAIASPAEQSLHRFRKGYCTMVGGDFAGAAAEFDKAIAAWPTNSRRDQVAEPVSPALLALDAIARLKAGANDTTLDEAEKTVVATLANPSCTSALMPVAACEADLMTAREWLGWIDLRRGNLAAAAREFSQSSNLAWQRWVASRQAFDRRNYPEAAASGKRAIEEWDRQRAQTAPSFNDRIRPQPDLGQALTDLGGAQLVAGDAAAAILTLDRAVKAAPEMARAYYLRARAKERMGQQEAALADYNLASRTAFAGAKDLNSGEAHLYRGIVFYRRKDFARAEDEFSSALNFNISPALRADADAWRYMAAVSAGSCESSRGSLARALASVTPYFPKQEASDAMRACPITATAAQLR